VIDRVGGWARGEASQRPASQPTAESPEEAPEEAAAPPALAEPTAAPPRPTPVAELQPPESTSTGIPAGGVQLPSLVAEEIAVAALRPGDRILARTMHELVAFDLIDPLSREAIEHRHALLSADVVTATALTTPRRVVLPSTIRLGQSAVFTAVAGVGDAAPPPAGSIDALGIERPLD
jgi:hypothetical protein